MTAAPYDPSATGPELRLFCLPYAGGAAGVFSGWQARLPASVDVCPIELPGRGGRFVEPLPGEMDLLVEDVLARVEPRLDLPYAVFGHSFGSALAYEVTRHLVAEGAPPVRLLVSAFRAPSLPPPDHRYSDLPDAEFRRFLGELGGTPQVLLDDEEFMALLLPVVKHDFRLAEHYGGLDDGPLPIPVTAFGSATDQRFSLAEVRAWAAHTGSFTLHEVPGDHFFLNTRRDLLLDLLARELASSIGV
ncbi:thioesterase [Streptomyces durbertensis]|uniref:Thioesterase n=1 Tax=Streptomyces durbertensis TaxID=2448886 RepID=A0ABR6ECK7_9ACTN|nr:thioesterase [Streptomyces durbertensis]MBB1243056.1 thioesterase [Streptomyces durbertensis]